MQCRQLVNCGLLWWRIAILFYCIGLSYYCIALHLIILQHTLHCGALCGKLCGALCVVHSVVNCVVHTRWWTVWYTLCGGLCGKLCCELCGTLCGTHCVVNFLVRTVVHTVWRTVVQQGTYHVFCHSSRGPLLHRNWLRLHFTILKCVIIIIIYFIAISYQIDEEKNFIVLTPEKEKEEIQNPKSL